MQKVIEAEREAQMQAARCSPELVALIEAQARDARTTQWKYSPGLNDDRGLPMGRRWRA